MNNMLHFWSPFLKVKRRTAEIFSTILVLDTNSLHIFWNKRKKERPDDWRIAKFPPEKLIIQVQIPSTRCFCRLASIKIALWKMGTKKPRSFVASGFWRRKKRGVICYFAGGHAKWRSMLPPVDGKHRPRLFASLILAEWRLANKGKVNIIATKQTRAIERSSWGSNPISLTK